MEGGKPITQYPEFQCLKSWKHQRNICKQRHQETETQINFLSMQNKKTFSGLYIQPLLDETDRYQVTCQLF